MALPSSIRVTAFKELDDDLQNQWNTLLVDQDTDFFFWTRVLTCIVYGQPATTLANLRAHAPIEFDLAFHAFAGFWNNRPLLPSQDYVRSPQGCRFIRRAYLTDDGALETIARLHYCAQLLKPLQHRLPGLTYINAHSFNCSVCLTTFPTLDSLQAHCRVPADYLKPQPGCTTCQTLDLSMTEPDTNQLEAESLLWRHLHDCHFEVYSTAHIKCEGNRLGYDHYHCLRRHARVAYEQSTSRFVVVQWNPSPVTYSDQHSPIVPFSCLGCDVHCSSLEGSRDHLRSCNWIKLNVHQPLLGFTDDVVQAKELRYCCQWCRLGYLSEDDLLQHLGRHFRSYTSSAAARAKCERCSIFDFTTFVMPADEEVLKHVYDMHHDDLRRFHLQHRDVPYHGEPEPIADFRAIQRGQVTSMDVYVTQWHNSENVNYDLACLTSTVKPFTCSSCHDRTIYRNVKSHLRSAAHRARTTGSRPATAFYSSPEGRDMTPPDQRLPFEFDATTTPTFETTGREEMIARYQPSTWAIDGSGNRWYYIPPALPDDQQQPSPMLTAAQLNGRAFRGDEPAVVTTPPVTEGRDSVQCQYCQAWHWCNELGTKCCSSGTVLVPGLGPPPESLSIYLNGQNSAQTNAFRENSVKINDSLAMGYPEAEFQVVQGGGPTTIHLNGAVAVAVPRTPAPGATNGFRIQQVFLNGNINSLATQFALDQMSDRCKSIVRDLESLLLTLGNRAYLCLNVAVDYVQSIWERGEQIRAFRVEIDEASRQSITSLTQHGSGSVVVDADNGQPAHMTVVHRTVPLQANLGPEAMVLRTVVPGTEAGPADWSHERNGPVNFALPFTPAFAGSSVSFEHPYWLAIAFPILNIRGWAGWRGGLRLYDRQSESFTGKPMTPTQYYRSLFFRRHTRGNNLVNPFNYAGLVNKKAFCAIQANIFGIRAQQYAAVMSKRRMTEGVARQAVDAYGSHANAGKRVVPPDLPGGIEYMKNAKQNALTNLLHLGSVDFFVTMTFSAKDEDLRAAADGRASHHMDMEVTRLASLKFKRLLHDIKVGFFGKCSGYCATCEWQGRDLPHLHTILSVDQSNPEDVLTMDKVAKACVARMPDPMRDPDLASVIFRTNIHKCMDRCRTNYGCKYNFPFPYHDGIELSDDQLYATVERLPPRGEVIEDHQTVHFVQPDRTVDSFTYSKYENGAIVLHLRTGDVDCRSVVKYNPDLSRRYRCHINVEYLDNGGAAVPYLFKYVTKGNDKMAVNVVDEEGRRFQTMDGLFLNSHAALHRLLEMPLVHQYPSITVLPVHLPGEAQVTLDENMDADEVAAYLDERKPTKLEAYFTYNTLYPPAASSSRPTAFVEFTGDGRCPCHNRADRTIEVELYTPNYKEFGRKMRWDGRKYEWKPYSYEVQCLARLHLVGFTAKSEERFALRALLQHVPHPTSYDDLKTGPDGQVFETFAEAARAHHLLQSDDFWIATFNEFAVRVSSWRSCCNAFTTMLLNNRLSDIEAFVQRFLMYLRPDPRRQGEDRANAKAFLYLERLLQQEGSSWETLGLQHLRNHYIDGIDINAHEDDGIDADDESFLTVEEQLQQEPDVQLTASQRGFYDHIIGLLDHTTTKPINGVSASFLTPDQEASRLVYLDGPGGTGKTTVLKQTLKHMYATTPHRAVCLASTGVAAALLPGGMTMHRGFSLPIEIEDGCPSTLNAMSDNADQLRAATVIIVDEVSAADIDCITSIDNTLQDIMKIARPFGGKLVVVCGDLRQCAPVVEGGGSRAGISRSIKTSAYWNLFQQACFRLTDNLRVAEDDLSEDWCQWLLRVGTGQNVNVSTNPDVNLLDLTTSPYGDTLLCNSSDQQSNLLQLISMAFPSLAQGQLVEQELQGASILAARHAQVSEVNEFCHTLMPTPERVYRAYDGLCGLTHSVDQPELMNGLATRKIPPKALKLKQGTPVMVTRNLRCGLNNGTRGIVKTLLPTQVELLVTSGPRKGRTDMIPRIDHVNRHAILDVMVRRTQLPLIQCYAMTINKSQGQTLRRCVLDLRAPVFQHGGLYVALSRVSHPAELKIMLPANTTTTANVVHETLVSHLLD
eukprot:m.3665 g.3665  ORF g.3665 m.3665 type:complete len:2067 (+) comp6362_c0_seq1:74-6274(+)